MAELVKRTAFKITRLGQLVANLASERLGVPAGIIDLSLAPTPAIGDSVANILEEMGLESCGCCGTTACLALLNDAVKKGRRHGVQPRRRPVRRVHPPCRRMTA